MVLEAIRSNSFVGGVRIDAEAREISGFNPDRQSYVQSVERNGKPLLEPFVRHADLVTGETVLTFRMGPKPPTPEGAPSGAPGGIRRRPCS